MAGERCLIDTNVLVYATVAGSPWYDEARRWLADLQRGGISLYITTQIYREYLVVLTRGEVFEQMFTPDEALDILRTLRTSVTVLGETSQSLEILQDLVQRYQVKGKQVHDANIVAVMVHQNVDRLATYNQDDFKRYTEIILESLPNVV